MRSRALSVFLTCLFVAAVAPVFGQADVIVGDLNGVQNYGSAGDYYAYAVGTTSCNIGTVPLLWIQGNNQHPVIGQNLFRLKDGRFEQVGMSWLKHGFVALQQSLCDQCIPNPNGSALGVGCSDPYSAGLNGSQGNGPRSEVNAENGDFPFPYILDPPVQDLTSRRLRVHADDVNPALNANAEYWVEGHYVTEDDAVAGNHHNNASYRKVVIAAGPAQYALSFDGNTVREKSAIEVWPTVDPSVQLETVFVNDGKFIVAGKSTDLGNGEYAYEYAVYNMNSNRNAGSFSVPIGPSLTLSNVEFHGVPYHSGEELVYSQADWASNITATDIRWSTQTFAQNQNANAIRWGTMYSFRFVTNAAPINGSVTVGVHSPGTPSVFSVAMTIPDGTAVTPVTGLSCSNTGTGVDLSWTNGDVYDSIAILRDGNVVSTLAGSATTYSESVADGNYNYAVRAFIASDISPLTNCNVVVGLTHTLSLQDQTALAGQANLTVPLRGGSIAFLDGFSASIQYADDLLDGVAVDFAGSVPAQQGADFMMADVGSDYMTIEVVVDGSPPFSGSELPAGVDQLFANLVFSVTGTFNDGDTRELAFVNGLGSGVQNLFEDNGVSFAPFTMDGTLFFQNQALFIRGDCNSDGGLNLPDVIFMLNYLFAFGASPQCFSGCDLDDNGSLQLPDAIVLLNYLFAAGPAPVAPFPTAGADPTPDSLPCI